MSLKAIDIAYNKLLNEKEGMSFKELWSSINNELGYDEKIASRKKSQFYTDLTLDGRFVMLENNVWNLKSRCKYQQIEIDEDEFEENDDFDEENEDEFDDEDEEDEEENEEDEY
ncbi:MAG: DNA-directed RNA polymerase subunit delta [Erysipelotrichia bacterium]|nr:DNA-directed RNA polymerase subunit delta [Erysipelotrichia bacterium]